MISILHILHVMESTTYVSCANFLYSRNRKQCLLPPHSRHGAFRGSHMCFGATRNLRRKDQNELYAQQLLRKVVVRQGARVEKLGHFRPCKRITDI